MKYKINSKTRLTAILLLWVVVFLQQIGCGSGDFENRYDKAMSLIYNGRYQDAESLFLTLARDAGDLKEPESAKWRAKVLYQAGRIEHLYLGQPRRAVSRLRGALKSDPNADFAFDARKEIAFIFYDRIGDYRSAALEFERLVQVYSDREGIEEYLYRIAQCYFMLREFNQARTEARLLLEKHKTGKVAEKTRLLVANSYYVQGRYQEAVEAHKQLLDYDPDAEIKSRSLFELGMCYQELKNFIEAEKSYLGALQNHPRPDLVQLQMASLRLQMGEEGQENKEKLSHATDGRKYVTVPGDKGQQTKEKPEVSKEQQKLPKETNKVIETEKPKDKTTTGSNKIEKPKKIAKPEPNTAGSEAKISKQKEKTKEKPAARLEKVPEKKKPAPESSIQKP